MSEDELSPTHRSLDGLRAVRVVGDSADDIGGMKVHKITFRDRDGNLYCSPAEDFHALYVKIEDVNQS